MLCFVHIERAGGTTLHHIFRSGLRQFMTLHPWYRWTNESDSVFTRCEAAQLFRLFPRCGGFGGHTVRSYLGYEQAIGRPVRYMTFLRDPVARYISHYVYQKQVVGVPWTMPRFLAEARLDNFMTVRIAGSADLERAKVELTRRFAFVGLTDRFDESLLLLRRQIGLPQMPVSYEKKNARARDVAAEDLSGFSDQIREHNALDVELYEFARTQLFPEYQRAYPGDLARDVEQLRATNQSFRFSESGRILKGIRRATVHKAAEYLVRRHCEKRAAVKRA